MSIILTVCAGCERHVKTCDPACPFCGAEVAPVDVATHAPRVSRAALLALGAAGMLGTSVAVTSCVGTYGGPPPGYNSTPSSSDTDNTGGDPRDAGSDGSR